MAYFGLTGKSWREIKRGFVFCLVFALVLGHAGFWKELDNVLTQHERDLGSQTRNALESANADYLEFLYGAVGHAASLGHFVEAQDLGLLTASNASILESLQSTMSLYGRYADLTILDENGVALFTISRDAIQSHVQTNPQKPHSIFENLAGRSVGSVYVSQMSPDRDKGVVVEPVTPVVFVAIPIGRRGIVDGSRYLVIKGFAGRYLEPYLGQVARDFESVSFKLSFPGAPYYWRYDDAGWVIKGVDDPEIKVAGAPELLSLKFSLNQADENGQLISQPGSHLQIYSSLDERPEALGYFGLHPILEVEVLMESGQWNAYLAAYTKKIWWEIYFQHVFGALLLGVLIALFVAGFVFTRDRGRSKYEAERRRVETDHLTGALSRVGFERALSRYKMDTRTQAICVIDIDHFKQVNDRYGHAVGDQILCEVVHLLGQRLRNSDLLARWGGEEFILLLPLADVQSAASVAERFRLTVSQHNFFVDEETSLSVTISIGVSFLEDEGFSTAFTNADQAR
jgi:diguanylate cyclase (GGDEF)-like protein